MRPKVRLKKGRERSQTGMTRLLREGGKSANVLGPWLKSGGRIGLHVTAKKLNQTGIALKRAVHSCTLCRLCDQYTACYGI